MILKGFIQLYPFLKPAFDDEEIGRSIGSIVRVKYTMPVGYCYNRQSLNELVARRNLADFTPIDMEMEFAPNKEYRRKGRPAKDWDDLFKIQFRFGHQAFCHDYPPAIKEILATANRPGGMKLTQDEGLYLAERSRIYGIITEIQYQKAVEKMLAVSSKQEHFKKILSARKRLHMHEISQLDGFWHGGCKKSYEANALLWH